MLIRNTPPLGLPRVWPASAAPTDHPTTLQRIAAARGPATRRTRIAVTPSKRFYNPGGAHASVCGAWSTRQLGPGHSDLARREMGRVGIEPTTLGLRVGAPRLGWSRWSWQTLS